MIWAQGEGVMEKEAGRLEVFSLPGRLLGRQKATKRNEDAGGKQS